MVGPAQFMLPFIKTRNEFFQCIPYSHPVVFMFYRYGRIG